MTLWLLLVLGYELDVQDRQETGQRLDVVTSSHYFFNTVPHPTRFSEIQGFDIIISRKYNTNAKC
jgi:hypothetical protein